MSARTAVTRERSRDRKRATCTILASSSVFETVLR